MSAFTHKYECLPSWENESLGTERMLFYMNPWTVSYAVQ